MARNKIALIGSGMIGGTLAHVAAREELGDVVLFDIADGVARGKALDISEATPVFGKDASLKGAGDYAAIAGADVAIVTAGVPRKPGMSRGDLIEINSRIMSEVAENIKKYAPDSLVIVVSNPLDAMVTLCQRVTGFPHHRVLGMAGVLDSSRFGTFIAWELGVSVRDVNAMVLGGHGDAMVPIVRHANVNGVPVMDILRRKYGSEEKANEVMQSIIDRVRGAGGEIVALLKKGSAFTSPASCCIEMVEAMLGDQKRILPVCGWCNGEFGVNGYYVGVPAVIGANGIERIVEFDLSPDERAMFDRSVAAVKELVDSLPPND